MPAGKEGYPKETWRRAVEREMKEQGWTWVFRSMLQQTEHVPWSPFAFWAHHKNDHPVVLPTHRSKMLMKIDVIKSFIFHTHIGVNISERKSETEQTKKRKKREFVCFFYTARGRN